jgi:hypothetical protein
MKQNSIYTLIAIVLIVIFLILGLFSISSSKGTVTGLQVGNHFHYGFAINYSGTNYTTSTATGELFVRVNAIDSQLHLVQVNLTNTLSGSLRQVMLSQLDPPIPSRTLNQSFYYRGRAIGLHGENYGIQGEYFGWIHSTISIGEKLGAWTIVGETTQNVGAGSFATYEVVQTTYNLTKGTEYITVTHLYYEQLTGVLVHLEYQSIVRAQNDHSKIYYQESEIMDLTASSYNFPLLSKFMPVLILINPVLDMLATYGFFILLAIVVILVILLAKKQLVKRI